MTQRAMKEAKAFDEWKARQRKVEPHRDEVRREADPSNEVVKTTLRLADILRPYGSMGGAR